MPLKIWSLNSDTAPNSFALTCKRLFGTILASAYLKVNHFTAKRVVPHRRWLHDKNGVLWNASQMLHPTWRRKRPAHPYHRQQSVLDAGKLYLGRNENGMRIIQQTLKEITIWQETKGPKASPAAPHPKPEAQKSRNEMMIERELVSYAQKESSKNANKLLDQPIDLVQQLVATNIRVIPNIASTGRMNGFSFGNTTGLEPKHLN